MITFKIIDFKYDPTYENFEKYGEEIKIFIDCPCIAIRDLKMKNDFEGYILNMTTLELYSISNDLNGTMQTQMYIKTLNRE